jgi:hypothetical protein
MLCPVSDERLPFGRKQQSTIVNLISVFFTDEEIARMDGAMLEIESIIKGKAVNLTPKQRQASV